MATGRWLPLCAAEVLCDGGDGMRFEVRVGAEAATGFAVRYQGEVRAYLNRCAHVAMELDWLPGRFFDDEQRWLLCATHGAQYEPASGRCAGGPCAGRGSLRAIRVREREGTVYWQPDDEVREPPPDEAANALPPA